MIVKVCNACGKEKPLGDFHKQPKGKYGVRAQCKACLKEWPTDNTITEKQCKTCGIVKPLESYHKASGRSKGGRLAHCMACVREKYKAKVRAFDAQGLDSRGEPKRPTSETMARYKPREYRCNGWFMVCSRCNNPKPLHAYQRDAKAQAGRRAHCKDCDAKRWRDDPTYYEKRKERLRTNGRPKWYDERNRRRVEARAPDVEKRRRRAFQKQQTEAAKRNAQQAWEYWLDDKAPQWWLDAYNAALYKDEPWRNPRLSPAKQYRLRYRLDPGFATQERMRRQIRKAATNDGVAELIRGALKRGGRSRAVENALGYTIEELTRHLERQFTRGMTWEKYMRGEIHIDHIRPKAAFDMHKLSEWKQCWALANLRPAWAAENLRKRDSIEFLI